MFSKNSFSFLSGLVLFYIFISSLNLILFDLNLVKLFIIITCILVFGSFLNMVFYKENLTSSFSFKKGFRHTGDMFLVIYKFIVFSIIYIFGVGLTKLILILFSKNSYGRRKKFKKTYWKDFNNGNVESYFNQF